jgi:hypothetical protein
VATLTWNGAVLTVSAPGVGTPSQASVNAAAAQKLIDDAWRLANPNKARVRASAGVGGEHFGAQ